MDCACGGKDSKSHRSTKKHITWCFDSLVSEFLTLTKKEERIESLKKQRGLCRTGKVNW
jgi:hypothetical protein